MNNANQNEPFAKSNHSFLFAGCCALLSAFILAVDLMVVERFASNEDWVVFWFLISMFAAIPAAIALCTVRRPLLLSGAASASALAWSITLGHITLILNYDPFRNWDTEQFITFNILLCIASHFVWTPWAGYLFLSGKLGASS